MRKLNSTQPLPQPQPQTIPPRHALERSRPMDLLEHLSLISRVSHSHHCQLQQLRQHLPCHSLSRCREHRRHFRALLRFHSPSTLHYLTPSRHRLSIPRCKALSRRLARIHPNKRSPKSTGHSHRLVLRWRSSLRIRPQTSNPRCRL